MPPVNHTISRSITVNGVVEWPSKVAPADGHGRQGVNLEADDGGLTPVVTGTKRRWRYSWERPKPDIVDRAEAWPVSLTITDHKGDTFTAKIPIGFPRFDATHGDYASTAGTTYTLECEFWEA